MNIQKPLLIWDRHLFTLFSYPSYIFVDFPYNLSNTKCPWCGNQIGKEHSGPKVHSYWEASSIEDVPDVPTGSHSEKAKCQFCGWSYKIRTCWMDSPKRFLKECECLLLRDFNVKDKNIDFDINDLNVPLQAVGTYLKKHFSDIYNLKPHRFEELIEDVFANHGLKICLTQQSRDGGADIVLLEDDNSNQAIVEVKKYSKNRKVGIAIVDRLLGAAMRWNVRKAYLVATTKFSGPAQVASSTVSRTMNFDLTLWGAHRILKELQCYSNYYPPLYLIDPAKPLSEQENKI